MGKLMENFLSTSLKSGRSVNKIQDYPKDKHSLPYSPTEISVGSKTYMLSHPLRCSFGKEDNYFIVTSEQLDIIGTGLSRTEAEESFNEEFDYLFWRLNSLEDSQLSGRLRLIKLALNGLVNAVQ
jgi:hypothetical protein